MLRFLLSGMLACLPLATPAKSDNWTGLYFGGSVGLGKMATDSRSNSDFRSTFSSTSFGSIGWPPLQQTVTIYEDTTVSRGNSEGSDDGSFGAMGGVLFGGNLQLGLFVLGGEINMDWLDYTSRSTVDVQSTTTSTNAAVQSVDGGPFFPLGEYSQTYTENYRSVFEPNLDWKATILARAGMLVNDNVLAYGLIGYARAGFTNAPFDTRNGVSYGGGVDWALGDGWSIRAEYRRTEFEGWDEQRSETENYSEDNYDGTSTSSYRASFDASTDELKIGLTYRFFDSAYSPQKQ